MVKPSYNPMWLIVVFLHAIMIIRWQMAARIVEVNGVNVNQENHKQVVARIKSIETETKLLGIVQKSAWCNAMHEIFSCEINSRKYEIKSLPFNPFIHLLFRNYRQLGSVR